MLGILFDILSTVRSAARSRIDLLLESAALREQLEVYRRQVRRPKLRQRRPLWRESRAIDWKLQRALDAGEIDSMAAIAKALGVTRARVTQILDLAPLPVAVQE